MSNNNDKNAAGFNAEPQNVKNESSRQAALRYILEAWEEAVYDGIEPEQLAHAALYAALCDLVSTHGEEKTLEIIKDLPKRIENGEFTIYRTMQ